MGQGGFVHCRKVDDIMEFVKTGNEFQQRTVLGILFDLMVAQFESKW